MVFSLPLIASLGLMLLAAPDADAAHRHHKHKARHPHPPPRVRVVVKPPKVHAYARPCPGPGSVWVAGHPGHGGRWVPGHCEHVGPAPRTGWVYVSGYWNGLVWVSGFWRPSVRVGYTWVDAHVTEQDEYVAGYWEPEGAGPDGMMWRPGYFDGSAWVPGGWVPTETYSAYDENGELVFFAVGDGHVEELAIPRTSHEEGDPYPDETADASPLDLIGEDEPQQRHASVPD
jgi:hypothetical protein